MCPVTLFLNVTMQMFSMPVFSVFPFCDDLCKMDLAPCSLARWAVTECLSSVKTDRPHPLLGCLRTLSPFGETGDN